VKRFGRAHCPGLCPLTDLLAQHLPLESRQILHRPDIVPPPVPDQLCPLHSPTRHRRRRPRVPTPRPRHDPSPHSPIPLLPANDFGIQHPRHRLGHVLVLELDPCFGVIRAFVLGLLLVLGLGVVPGWCYGGDISLDRSDIPSEQGWPDATIGQSPQASLAGTT
jgi:hypothetical protein